jgi:hypothetical protein
MKVGQRAYVSISDGTTEVRTKLGAAETSFFPENMYPLPANATIKHSFTIHNAGNTPASVRKIDTQYSLPTGWVPLREPDDAETDILIAAKASVNHQYLHEFSLNKVAHSAFGEDKHFLGGFEEVIANTDLTFVDVFDDEHRIAWCWKSDLEKKTTIPARCITPIARRTAGSELRKQWPWRWIFK